jgi:hypothetical protein
MRSLRHGAPSDRISFSAFSELPQGVGASSQAIDRTGAFQGEAGGEDRQAAKHNALGLWEQLGYAPPGGSALGFGPDRLTLHGRRLRSVMWGR